MSKLPGDPSAGGKTLFAIGVRLPERNREWVRHELTDAGWRTRLTVRHLVLMLPLCALLALLPGAIWIRVMVPALFGICSVGIVAMYADDIRVSRMRRHGLEPPNDPDLGRPRALSERAGRGGAVARAGVGAGRGGWAGTRVPERYVPCCGEAAGGNDWGGSGLRGGSGASPYTGSTAKRGSTTENGGGLS